MKCLKGIIHHYFLCMTVLKFFQGNNNDIEDKEVLRVVDDYINKSIIDENSDSPLIAGVFYIEIWYECFTNQRSCYVEMEEEMQRFMKDYETIYDNGYYAV